MTKNQRIAVVTGGSRGLGRNIALTLARQGIDVVLTFHSAEAKAAEVVKEISALGRKAVALQLDVAKVSGFADFTRRLDTALQREWHSERIHVLVHNAGAGGSAGAVPEVSEAAFDQAVNEHFKGPFFLTQALLPRLADGGRIVNITSGLSRYGYSGQSVYSAVKGALDVFTRGLALELGPRGITVNSVAPGGIETDFGGGYLREPTLRKMVADQTPIGRVGQPEDIGGIVALLVAEESRFMTGQRLEVTGGFRL